MARKSKGSIYEEDTPGLDISSLIDVCFLLLIYFIVTTTIQASEQDVNMKLPSVSTGGDPSEIDPMLIKIDPSGIIYLGTADSREILDTETSDRSVPLLSQRIELYKSSADLAGSTPVVQMSIDGDAEQQRVLDVLNCLAKNEIKSVTFTDLID